MALASYLHIRQGVLDGILIVVLLAVLGWGVFLLWGRSYNGELAWECLHAPACLNQALQAAETAPAAPHGPIGK